MDHRDRRACAAQEAAEWVLRFQDQNMTRAERAEYVEWLRESPLNVAEMLRASYVHGELANFPHWNEIAPLDASSTSVATLDVPHAKDRPERGLQPARASQPARALQPARAESRPGRRGWWLTAVAASVAAVGVALLYFAELDPQTIDTSPGERREVTLADGSVVRVGPMTTLRARFTERERRVVLSRGDALFRVAKDPTKPFLVETDHTRVRAVGTAFGVERHGDSVIVTVEEGRVSVTQAVVASAPSSRPAIPTTEISLGADQQIVVPQIGPMGRIRKVDSRRELSWSDGRLVFEHASVAEVVERFNRFNRVQMQVLDPQLAARPVSAVFDASDPDSFVVFLESVANVRVTRPSPNMIVIAAEGPP
jgi:transmembrane sensor